MSTNRRKFLNILLGIGGIGGLTILTYPILSYLIPPKSPKPKVNSVKAGSATAFPANSYKIIKFGRKPVILVKTDQGKFVALSATCTHLDCIVQYKKDTKQIWCACHNGIYDLNGRNVSGPPPRPLKSFAVKIVKDEIIITQAG
ncbi:cytochrome b6-f complex iron-sulfur subunit [bacterium BMS3Abin03]|nr:cytochrome b6-f complex iron-sulfur subunit [bacterium BMS3Abin03]